MRPRLAMDLLFASCLSVRVRCAGRLTIRRSNSPAMFDRSCRTAVFDVMAPTASAVRPTCGWTAPTVCFGDHDGHPIVVPGRPDTSELMRRMTSVDPDFQMPPPESGLSLSQSEIGPDSPVDQRGSKMGKSLGVCYARASASSGRPTVGLAAKRNRSVCAG